LATDLSRKLIFYYYDEMKQEPVRISAKNLGQLALPDYCPRCFYLKLKLQFKLPWQIFPGIFSTIDSYSKKITWQYYKKHKTVPPWFKPFGKFTGLLPSPHHSKFFIVDKKTGIKLNGMCDDIFKMADGRYFIWDYKTAKFTENQDKLLPLYVTQLNGYAYIFETMGMGKIGGLGLCYYEPQGNAPTVTFETVMQNDGFVMPFKAHLKKIGLGPEAVVLPLLAEVRRYVDMVDAPRSREGCGDCEILEQIAGWKEIAS
jgi:hypothetical protein